MRTTGFVSATKRKKKDITRKGKQIFTRKDVKSVRIIKKVDIPSTSTKRQIENGKNLRNDVDFSYGKITFKNGKTVRAFFKPVLGSTRSRQYREARRQIKIRDTLREAGLPVLKADVIAKDNQVYIAEPAFLREGFKKTILEPINTPTKILKAKPTFLKKLNAKEHKELIENIAKDYATILNLNLSTSFFDIHGFRQRKDGSWQRIIMDTSKIMNKKSEAKHVYTVALTIKKTWIGNSNKPERELFKKTLIDNIKDTKIKAYAEEAFKEKSFWKNIFNKIKNI